METVRTTAKNSGLLTYSSSMLVNKHTRPNIYVPTEDRVEKPSETKRLIPGLPALWLDHLSPGYEVYSRQGQNLERSLTT